MRFLACAIPLLLIVPSDLLACPFCSAQGQTLLGEVNQADMILIGTLKNPQRDPTDYAGGTTELDIELVVKPHAILGKRKQITLPRYVAPDPQGNTRFLVFLEVYKDKLDPYRGIPLAKNSDLGKYLQGAIALRDKSIKQRLAFFFKYLDHPESEIANDALTEFANADYPELRPIYAQLPADKVASWLTDPKTPASRYGLYGSILGHCGDKQHAKLLRSILDDPKRRFLSGLDGILAGYILLAPEDGWSYLKKLLSDPKQDFLNRYAGLRTARFFWKYRTDVITKGEILEAVAILMEQDDIADIPIDDLRKWEQWQLSKKVIALAGKPTHQVPIVQRSIIRYALSCPANDVEAAAFLQAKRAKDPKRIKEIEELLRLEQEAAASKQPANNPKP